MLGDVRLPLVTAQCLRPGTQFPNECVDEARGQAVDQMCRWSERDLKALKVFIFIVLTGAIIFGVEHFITAQQRQADADAAALEACVNDASCRHMLLRSDPR